MALIGDCMRAFQEAGRRVPYRVAARFAAAIRVSEDKNWRYFVYAHAEIEELLQADGFPNERLGDSEVRRRLERTAERVASRWWRQGCPEREARRHVIEPLGSFVQERRLCRETIANLRKSRMRLPPGAVLTGFPSTAYARIFGSMEEALAEPLL
ncbi:MAG: hypothetical protein OXR73_25365 [Myxococcales bacterium]|nr:hypothetical protein [Myxococcales bacterium]